MKLAALVATGLLAATVAVEDSNFRWERGLTASGAGLVTFEPDGLLYAHARRELADLRILDTGGRQVPWRRLPDPAPRAVKEIGLLNAGRQGRAFVGLLDLGPSRVVRNRAELVIANERDFVGRVTVFGSDDRRTFTRLSTTTVFDLRGATAATSTTLVFPPTDHRFLRLRGVGVPVPVAARVYNAPLRRSPRPVPARMTVEQLERKTQVRLDVRFAKRPVDVLRFTTSTPRFDRDVVISGSDGPRNFLILQRARIVRLGGVAQLELRIEARERRLSVVVENGDDEPLRGLRVEALARPRTIVLARGFEPPFHVLYGNSGLQEPEYDFAQLPSRELKPLVAGTLGGERENPAWKPPEDTRSFVERNPRLVEISLAVVALGLGVGGFFALRRRA